MLEVLRDPLSRTIIAMLGIAAPSALAITLFVLTQRYRRKALSCTLVTTSLTSVHESYAERVKILFDGELARKPSLIVVTITNEGREPINSNDFVNPLVLDMPEGGRILTAEVTDTTPKTLKNFVTFDLLPPDATDGTRRTQRVPSTEDDSELIELGRSGNYVALRLGPLLLNGGDSLTLKLLVSSSRVQIS